MLRILWVVRNRIVKNVKKSPNMANCKSGISSQINLDRGCFPCGSVIKNLPNNAGDIREAGLIPTLGRSPGGRHGNPLQHFCLESPMDREAWWAMVHRVTKSWT